MMNPEAKSAEDVQAAQKVLDDAGLSHWTVGSINGSEGDVLAYFSAQRIIPGSAFQVTHRDAAALLGLAREADARFSVAPQAVTISSGVQSA